MNCLGYELRPNSANPGDLWYTYVNGLCISAMRVGDRWMVRVEIQDHGNGGLAVDARAQTVAAASFMVERIVRRELPRMSAMLWPDLSMGGAA